MAPTLRRRGSGGRVVSARVVDKEADAEPATTKQQRRPTSASNASATASAAAASASPSRLKSFAVRTGSTFVLIGAFAFIIYLGHVPLALMILGIQALMVRELLALGASKAKAGERAAKGSSGNGAAATAAAAAPPPSAAGLLSGGGVGGGWYFFCVAAFWIYLRFIHRQLEVEVGTAARTAAAEEEAAYRDAAAVAASAASTTTPPLSSLVPLLATLRARSASLAAWVLRRHTFVAFALYVLGWVSFVLRLERGNYLWQFRQFAWAHLILLLVFVPSSFFVSNIFDGIVWFLLPASLVVLNDIFAYLAGFFFGKTPLIKLSPKKTWEGFLGGAVGTVLASWFLADAMSRSQWLTCPRTDLSMGSLRCDDGPGPTFAKTVFRVSDLLLPPGSEKGSWGTLLARAANSPRFGAFEFTARPMQLHAVALAAFASLVAPFGGFFASGLKRSLKVKDFGHSIPGHGGMTDRMDCQVVMAVFSYLYYHACVAMDDDEDSAGWRGGGKFGGFGRRKATAASLAAAASAAGLPAAERLRLAAALVAGVAAAAAAANASSSDSPLAGIASVLEAAAEAQA